MNSFNSCFSKSYIFLEKCQFTKMFQLTTNFKYFLTVFIISVSRQSFFDIPEYEKDFLMNFFTTKFCCKKYLNFQNQGR